MEGRLPCRWLWGKASTRDSALFIRAILREGRGRSPRLIGRETLRIKGRGGYQEPVLAWAEAGRTKGLQGSLSGLSGAPVLDRRGRVMGVTIAEAPRPGRIYTTAPDSFVAAIGDEQTHPGQALGQSVTTRNYGVVSDQLRRDLRVAQVICLAV